ncbi:MAG: M48 family metallopeptidase [Melioribacter sp.]|nr:M48 family metallopeptidase [Melioribacter sp.]
MSNNSKKYNNIKLAIGISKGIFSFILIFLFVWLGWSLRLENFLRNYFSNNYFILVIYTFIIGIVSSMLFFPINFYSEFILEHKYNLSNQTFFGWVWENIKEAFVGYVIGIPILLIFYFILNSFYSFWWLPFSVVMFLFSVLFARIVPVLILPLFYKVVPIDNENLKSKIIELCSSANMKVDNIYKFNMSKNTKKGNAAFTGLGKTKRILLSDTLLDNYTDDEVETVVAHELGHYKKKHIIKNIVIGTVFSFLSFYLMALLYESTIKWFGFNSILQISALPILVLWGSIVGLVLTPISNYFSRKFEYQADEYAVLATGKKETFIRTLEKLTEQNLGDKEPHPLVEWFFYSHPSIKKRISAIEKISS